MKCTSHLIGFDWECRSPKECENEDVSSDSTDDLDSASSGSAGPTSISDVDVNPADDSNDVHDVEDFEEDRVTYKDDSNLRDQQSTGRKRAAKWFPLDEETLCEWAGKKNCGGGRFPITGCAGNNQQARHHGPDKNTLNNEKGNVHRICHQCHNRWHTLNDTGYVWGAVQNPHEPKRANNEDFVEAEKFWEGRAVKKVKD